MSPGAPAGSEARRLSSAAAPDRGGAAAHVLGLDVLRLCGAALVLVYHFGFWNWTRGNPLAQALPGMQPAWGDGVSFGWVGVEVFFVISGFVIAFSTARATRYGFFRSRFLRLAPVSWLSASLVLAIGFGLASDRQTLLLTYVETLVFWPLNAIDGVWWTLGIEVDFYLLACLLIGRGSAWSLERVMTVVGLSSGVFWVFNLAGQGLLSADGTLGLLRYLILKAAGNRELQLLLVQHGCFFALGVLIQAAMVRGLTRRRLLVGVFLVAACLLEIVGQNGIIDRASLTVHSSVVPAAVWLGLTAMLILSCRYNALLLRLAGSRASLVRFGGLLTYPLYLMHNAVGIAVTRLLAPALGGWAVAVGIGTAVACAAVVAAIIEPALRTFIARRVWPTPVASAPPARALAASQSVQTGA